MEFIWMVGMEEPFAWTAGVLELGLSMLESGYNPYHTIDDIFYVTDGQGY